MEGAATPPPGHLNQDADGNDQQQDQNNDNTAPASPQDVLPNQPTQLPLLHNPLVLQ